MEKPKTIMVLPGTFWQLQLVKRIKELGYKVLVVNPASDSPCFEIADGYLQSDIFNKEKVIAYGKEHKIDAIMSDQCDIAMNLVAYLGKEFNLPTLDQDTAALYTDKFLMREFCKKNNLYYPEYKLCTMEQDAIDFMNEINNPIIIKPLDSNASHGVFYCNSKEEIKKYFKESLSYSRSKKFVLAERYINGTEFTIDGIKTPNGHFTLAISEKKHFSHNLNIANELLFTHSNKQFDYNQLRYLNDAFVLKSPLAFGFTHAEYKYENGKFYLIEIAARGGGNMISSCITQWMSGYDTYKYLINCALGEISNEDFSIRDEFKERCAILKFFSTPNRGGIVKKIEGLDYLDKEKDIKCYRLNFKVGDTIQDALNDSARIGFFIACSENMDKLNAIVKNIDQTFKIKY